MEFVTHDENRRTIRFKAYCFCGLILERRLYDPGEDNRCTQNHHIQCLECGTKHSLTYRFGDAGLSEVWLSATHSFKDPPVPLWRRRG